MGTNTATECRTTSCAPQAVPDPPRVSHSHAGVTEWLCAGSLRERGQAKGTALPDVLWDSISLQHFLREIYSCNTHLCGLLREERNFSGKMELSVSSSTQSKSKNKPGLEYPLGPPSITSSSLHCPVLQGSSSAEFTPLLSHFLPFT